MSNYCIRINGGNYADLEFEDIFLVGKIASLFPILRRHKDEIRQQLKILEDMEEDSFIIIKGIVFVKIKKTEEVQAKIDKEKEEKIKAQKYNQMRNTKTKKIKYDY